MDEPIVIVGAGHAGVQLAASLRTEGYQEKIVLLDSALHLPYHRPPLSKTFMSGDAQATDIALRPAGFYELNAINLVLGEAATSIDRASRRLQLKSGRALPYQHLVLATGVRPRPLGVPGADLDGVGVLGHLTDAHFLRERLAVVNDIVVVGAGFIGLEFAAGAAKANRRVHIIEAAPRVMGRVVSQPMSEFFTSFHTGNPNIDILLSAGLAEIEGEASRVKSVLLTDGRRIPADLVLLGIGVTPAIELAASAGLACDNGVIVGETMQTADPAISAIGDIARHPTPHFHMPIRVESVQNANDQARCVARYLTGKPQSYSALPWFWSDQADKKLQIAGIPGAYDEVAVRGAGEAFSVFGYRNGRLASVESVNVATDHMVGRKILAAGKTVTPFEAADLSFDLKSAASRP